MFHFLQHGPSKPACLEGKNESGFEKNMEFCILARDSGGCDPRHTLGGRPADRIYALHGPQRKYGTGLSGGIADLRPFRCTGGCRSGRCHHLCEIDTENRYFYTKGDANDVADGSPVLFDNLVGKPVFCIPKLGYFSAWLTNPPGTYIAICGGVVLLLLVFLPDLLDKADEADRRKADKAEPESQKDS